MLNFLLLLNSRNREVIIDDILKDLFDYRNLKEGLVNVNIKTAIELDENEKEKLIQKIDAYTKKKSIPVFETDKKIIGGFVAKIQDTIIDSSIKHQLELLRKKFREGDVILN
jgi:F-type H+-transporting ATPase subunit delta